MSRCKKMSWACCLLFLLLAPNAAVGAGNSPESTNKIVITAADMQKMNVRSVKELLNLIPGVKAGDSSVHIRGSRSVRVLLDGLPLNDRSSHGIKLDLVPFRELAKVVVIKGGGGVAFGDDSSGGVVLFVTKKVHGGRTFLEVSGGSLNMRGIRGNLTRTWKQWGLAVNGEFKRDNGFRVNNDKEEKKAGLKITYTPRNWGSGRAPTLSVDFGQRRRGSAGYVKYPTPRARAHGESLGCSLTWSRWGLKSGSFFTRFRNERINPDRDIHSVLTTWTLKQDLGRAFRLPVLGRVRTGAMFVNDHGEGSGLTPRDEQSYALFMMKYIKFKSLPISLRLGLRGNIYSQFDAVLNPEVELGWEKGSVRVTASVSKSNNTPNFRQRYFRHSSLIPNPDLGMETSVNYGLGLSWNGLSRLAVDLSLFDNEIKDRITYVRGDGGVGQYRNAGETYMRGVDAAFTLRAFGWLEFKPSYTYLEAKDRGSGLWLSGKPKQRIKADLMIRPIPGLMLAAHYSYTGEVFTRSDNKESGPAYSRVDLRGEYAFGRYRVFAKVDNLFDRQYLYADGLPAPPRTWLLGVSCEF